MWHGGEPLLMPVEYYQKALLLQEKSKKEGQSYSNSIQTNGTLINQDWCDFFKKYQFTIGISLDGVEESHNLNRKYSNNKGSYTDVVNSIRLLQKNDIPFGVLIVLNEHILKSGALKIFNFLVDELGVKAFSFIPVKPANNKNSGEVYSEEYCKSNDSTEFMKKIFDLWLERDDSSIQIREIDSLLKVILGGTATACTLAGHCLGSYFHIEPDGTVFHCDKYLGDSDYQLGNITTNSFYEIQQSSKLKSLISEEETNLKLLDECPKIAICNGGCPHDRYIAKKIVNKSQKCCGQLSLIAHMEEKVISEITSAMPQ
ncbi:Radical SAM additional 4Fe4S-binding SPASM domain [Tenacibaculum sediminilitoris]